MQWGSRAALGFGLGLVVNGACSSSNDGADAPFGGVGGATTGGANAGGGGGNPESGGSAGTTAGTGGVLVAGAAGQPSAGVGGGAGAGGSAGAGANAGTGGVAGGLTGGSGGNGGAIAGSGGNGGNGGAPPVPCSPDGSQCEGGGTCCSGICVDPTSNIDHCGGCGLACTDTQFCGTSPTVGCATTAIANLCNNAVATSIESSVQGDDAASSVVRLAIGANCTPAPQLATSNQAASTLINNTTGEPLVGPGNLLIAVGGDFYHAVGRYLNVNRGAPTYNAGNEIRRSADDSVIVNVSDYSATLDYVIIQLARHPTNGSLVLNAYGWELKGTNAAAWYLANVMLPNLSGFDKAWYVYRWNDTNTDMMFDQGEFTLVGSGN